MARNKHLQVGFTVLFVGLLFAGVGTLTAHHTACADPGVLYAAPMAQGNGDCSDWANACTLQTALANAISGDEIWVKAGVHIPDPTGLVDPREASFNLKDGVALYGGFAGNENNRDERNWEANITVLSGDIDGNDITDPNGVVTTTAHITGTNSYHVVKASSVMSATLDGFVITAGKADGSFFWNQRGGGMYNFESSPTVRNLTFSGNLAQYGGGMYNEEGSNAALAHVIFRGNAANSEGGAGSPAGGGMYNNGSSPTLEDVTFSENSAAHAGGGMYNYTSNPVLNSVTFSGNSATNGGGMYNFGFNQYNQSKPTLTHVTFVGNRASISHGGGMYNYQSSPTLTDVAFSGNTAMGHGGGMYSEQESNPRLIEVTFSSNSAPWGDGGGMYSTGSTPRLDYVTFEDNSAENGGGLYSEYSVPALTDVVFYSNTATASGGGLYSVNDNGPYLTHVDFMTNTATVNGGGSFIEGGGPGLYQVTFHGNGADSGGGLYLSSASSSAGLSFVTFYSNTAKWGGGMFNSYGAPVITDAAFNNNTATYFGGGLHNTGGSPRLTHVTFAQNSATAANSGGGGMVNLSNSAPVLTGVTFRENTAARGGGMYNSSSHPALVNGMFENNTATQSQGGGVYNNAGSLEFTNVTFSGNVAATEGGGMYNHTSAVTLTNLILWGDTAPDGSEIYNVGSAPLVVYSDIQGCGSSGSGWNSACGTDGGGNIDANPRFVDPAIGDLHLGCDSPAIDAGDNTAVPSGVTTDLDGNPRFTDVPCVPDTGNGTPPIVDMGACETQSCSWEVYLPLILRNF